MKELLSDLNDEQKKAVLHTKGPLIIFAGAGSGKTRILTRRAAYLISECKVEPEHILAITFTNKAADEMKTRIKALVGEEANSMWISTFHSMCARILRKYATYVGYNPNFTIYDTDDARSLIKNIIKDLDYTKVAHDRTIQSMISSLKNSGITLSEYEKSTDFDKVFFDIYSEYDEHMIMNNSMDFDDLLLKTKELFDNHIDVLYDYQDQFQYVMVDEYQDTNKIQFELVEQLSSGYGNICVVGDDDQSIYKFRGADITNILNFESTFPHAKKILLEQNYRSTKNILDAANGVIANNKHRTEKKLWTTHSAGEKVNFIEFDDATLEAYNVIVDIKKNKYSYSDVAILYRSNMQSRLLEESCFDYNIPYHIVGGINFYQRKEIKDMVAYLKILANPSDEISVKRIINIPKRSIGKTTIGKIEKYSKEKKQTFFQSLLEAEKIPSLSAKTVQSIKEFTIFILKKQKEMELAGILDVDVEHPTPYTISQYLNFIYTSWYNAELESNYAEEELINKKENVVEFIDKIISMEKESSPLKLHDLLENIALISEKNDDKSEKITMMTLHASKGLEFKKVYIVGMNNGLFPSDRSIFAKSEDLEEERRLCYVGITRAMESLTLTAARSRFMNGKYVTMDKSMFINEIPRSTVIKRRIH